MKTLLLKKRALSHSNQHQPPRCGCCDWLECVMVPASMHLHNRGRRCRRIDIVLAYMVCRLLALPCTSQVLQAASRGGLLMLICCVDAHLLACQSPLFWSCVPFFAPCHMFVPAMTPHLLVVCPLKCLAGFLPWVTCMASNVLFDMVCNGLYGMASDVLLGMASDVQVGTAAGAGAGGEAEAADGENSGCRAACVCVCVRVHVHARKCEDGV